MVTIDDLAMLVLSGGRLKNALFSSRP